MACRNAELGKLRATGTSRGDVRPIHHRLADRVRARIFLCMAAYYVEWHMREAWRPGASTAPTFAIVTTPTAAQQRALDLLGKIAA